jgi:hypothetical protein
VLINILIHEQIAGPVATGIIEITWRWGFGIFAIIVCISGFRHSPLLQTNMDHLDSYNRHATLGVPLYQQEKRFQIKKSGGNLPAHESSPKLHPTRPNRLGSLRRGTHSFADTNIAGLVKYKNLEKCAHNRGTRCWCLLFDCACHMGD